MEDGTGTEADGGAPARTDDTARFNEALQRFGHDMRSAVSDVVGGLRLVDFDRLDPETRTQIERVSAAGDALASLVESALLLGSGPSASSDSGVPLATLVDHWRKRWTGHASESGVAFEMRVDVEADLAIRVPRTTMDRIASNIVGNALDHAGGADVRLSVSRTEDGGLEVEVADAGPGFDPAAPLDRSRTGRGLGLGIARDLARQAGATLDIAAGPPLGGAVVRLVLPPGLIAPCAKQPPDRAELPDLSRWKSSWPRTTRPIRRSCAACWNGWARGLSFASDGAEALDAWSHARFRHRADRYRDARTERARGHARPCGPAPMPPRPCRSWR
jgi:two-component system aerobic respiration control sensor histidine kinase ArcB